MAPVLPLPLVWYTPGLMSWPTTYTPSPLICSWRKCCAALIFAQLRRELLRGQGCPLARRSAGSGSEAPGRGRPGGAADHRCHNPHDPRRCPARCATAATATPVGHAVSLCGRPQWQLRRQPGHRHQQRHTTRPAAAHHPASSMPPTAGRPDALRLRAAVDHRRRRLCGSRPGLFGFVTPP